MIINIRGTSGSGKSTLVKRFLDEHDHTPMWGLFGDWKRSKIIAYEVEFPTAQLDSCYDLTYVVGRYETQCGGCDAMSYKGSHEDIEKLVRDFSKLGNVIFEGLTISSTLTRWLRIADENHGDMIFAFMMTPEEECYRRILARSGREPKRSEKGIADYQIKYRACMRHLDSLKEKGYRTLELTSDDIGYQAMLDCLKEGT